MKGITWARASHGLFDYETRHPNKSEIETKVSCKLIRTGLEIKKIALSESVPLNS